MKKINNKKIFYIGVIIIGSLLRWSESVQAAPAPMQVISRNKPAFASGGQASSANDSDYDTTWRSSGQPAWIAYDLSSVPTSQRQQLIVAWHMPSYIWYDYSVVYAQFYNVPGPYVIEGNTASGGGSAPTSGWNVLYTSPNPQTHHNNQHYISNFGGNNWIRFRSLSGNPNNEGGNSDISINLDIHDAHLGAGDSWFFAGDSITSGALMTGSYSELINSANSNYFPAVTNGGIPFMGASSVAPHFPRWLALFPGKYVGLAYGTNDVGSDPNAFYNSMKNLVDLVLAAGKTPVIPTIPWASSKNNTDLQALNSKITQLKADYGGRILDGPDLYSVFLNQNGLLEDGLHPNAAGGAAYRQAWATKMLAIVYNSASQLTVSISASPASISSGGSSTLTWSSTNATSCTASGAWSGAKATGGSQSTGALTANATFTLTCTGSGETASQSTAVTVATSGPIPGDINLDHIVNSLDWSIMSANWLTNNSGADLNKDGLVNSLDFSILSSNWLRTW